MKIQAILSLGERESVVICEAQKGSMQHAAGSLSILDGPEQRVDKTGVPKQTGPSTENSPPWIQFC